MLSEQQQIQQNIKTEERHYAIKPFSDKQEVALEKQIPKIRLVGWSKDPIEITQLEINVGMEGYVWLNMTGKDGKEYQTGLLKESV